MLFSTSEKTFVSAAQWPTWAIDRLIVEVFASHTYTHTHTHTHTVHSALCPTGSVTSVPTYVGSQLSNLAN
jgi:hypothetical protein